MEDYSEKQQLERMKQWVQENGLSIVLGAALGIVGIYGWTAWTKHQQAISQQISSLLYQAGNRISDGDIAQAVQDLEGLVKQYDDRLYSDMGRLLLARAYVEQGNLEQAIKPLQTVIDRQSILSSVAIQRMARLYIALERYDQALALLDKPLPPSYQPMVLELKGDIAYAQGNLADAAKHYQQAIMQSPEASGDNLLQMKQDELAYYITPPS